MTKNIMPYIIPIIFLTVVVAAVIYASNRLGWAFNFSPKYLYIGLGLLLLTFFFTIGLIMNTNPTSGLSHIISNTATIGLGVITIMLLSIIALDITNLFAKYSPKVFGIIALSLTALVSICAVLNATNVRVVHQDIKLTNLQEPLRIAQLSDVHIGHFWGKKTLQKLVDKVKLENVDAVVITGDLFDGRVRLSADVLSPLKELGVPSYFVSGNHDSYTGEGEIKQFLEQNGVTVLDNKVIDIKGSQIVGLDYMPADRESVDMMHHAPSSSTTIQEELANMGLDKQRASILLHHNPIGAKYVNQYGIGLYLAGHTHGGQLFPATIIAWMMFDYNKGLHEYEKDGTQIYVSQGSGTFGPPMRLGTFSEITIFNLQKK